jgi:chromosome segregation ATPase
MGSLHKRGGCEVNLQEQIDDLSEELDALSVELSRVKLERDTLSQVLRDLQKQLEEAKQYIAKDLL